MYIRIDQNMLTEELYRLRALIGEENDAAREKLAEIITLVAYAPRDEKQASFPRARVNRG